MFGLENIREAQEFIKNMTSPVDIPLKNVDIKKNNFVFYAFEFEDTGTSITPISLGMVAKNRELYLVNSDYDWSQCKNEWLVENVKACIEIDEASYASRNLWGVIIENWLDEMGGLTRQHPHHRLVAYYADYDHVTLAQLWGEMILMPCNMPMWTLDLKQWMDDLNLVAKDIPIPEEEGHNALWDARWNMKVYNWLTENYVHPAWSCLQWKK